MPDGHQHRSVAHDRVQRHRNAERRGGGSCGKNAGERRWGGGQSGIRMVPARLNARCVMVATECVATGADWMAGATTWVWMMWRIRNQGGSKRADENRHRAGGKNPRTEWFT